MAKKKADLQAILGQFSDGLDVIETARLALENGEEGRFVVSTLRIGFEMLRDAYKALSEVATP
jgi:hypothetical protein